MNDTTRLFMTKGKGADSVCRSCYARNMLFRIDDLEGEAEWWRQEFLRMEGVAARLHKQLNEVKKERDNYRTRLEELLHSNDKKCKKEIPKFIKSDTKKRGRKKPGAKVGHPGFSRKRPDVVDEVVEVNPDRCPICNSFVLDIKGSIPEEHFVEDIVSGSVKVTNYRRHIMRYQTGSGWKLGTKRGQAGNWNLA